MAIPNETNNDGTENNISHRENLVENLHNKAKLPSLRTYQGDVAEFIKERDESVISIAMQEKAKKEKETGGERGEKKERYIPETEPEQATPRKSGEGFQVNLTIILSSLLLLVGGTVAFIYVIDFINKEPATPPSLKTEIIPYNDTVTLVNITRSNLGAELANIAPTNGTSIVKLSDQNGRAIESVQEFFQFIGVSPPAALSQTLEDKFVLGALNSNGENVVFIILLTKDFGITFSSLLEWETKMLNDFSFLTFEKTGRENEPTATSTRPDPRDAVFIWKDLIIKNKDTRALVNSKNQAKIAYTFLDKGTVLIVNNLDVINTISSAYASRSFTR